MNNDSEILRVFLCHAKEDKPTVRDLYKRLTAAGLDVWLDEMNLLPGQDWELEITKAVHSSHIVIICLSPLSVKKDGYVQTEIRRALDAAERKPEGSIFLIPVRLEECIVPLRLHRWQWVDLFSTEGYEKLLAAIRARSDELGIPLIVVNRLLSTIRSAIQRASYEDIVAAASLVDPAILPLEPLRELTQALLLASSKIPSASPAALTSLSGSVDCLSRLNALLPHDVMSQIQESAMRFKYSEALINGGRFQDALEVLAPVLNSHSSPVYQSQWQLLVAGARRLYALALMHLQRFKDTVDFIDRNSESWPDESTSHIFQAVFSVLKMESLKGLGRKEEAEVITAQFVERCRSASDSLQGVEALSAGAYDLRELGKYDSAIPLLEAILTVAGGGETRRLRELIADSYYKLAECRRRTGDYEGSITTCNELLERFKLCETPSIEASVAWGMTELERSLREAKRFEEAERKSQETFDRFKDSTNEETNSAVAWAFAERGMAFKGLKEYGHAVAAYAAFLEHFDNVDKTPFYEKSRDYSPQISFVLGEKAWSLSMLGEHEAAVAVCDEAIRRFKDTSSMNVRLEVAWCMVERAYNLRHSGHVEDSAAQYEAVIQTFGDERRDDFRNEVRAAIQGVGMCRLYQAKQALSRGDEETGERLLAEAEDRLLEAGKRMRKAEAVGTLGYIAFLRGDSATAKSLLREAYAMEGEDWRTEELKELQLIKLSQDYDFVEMIRRCSLE
jgi:tetratricopeptide (TPR) repeat protein